MPLIKSQGKEKSWIKYIKLRIKKNKNFLCFISGSTGSGKSYSSLRIAEELDPEFSIERVVFSGVELMELINSGKLKSGSVVIFEEVGVAINNRNWQSTINKMINYLLQTFRHRKFILLFNAPYLDFIDSGTKKLFHSELSTQSIDFKNKQVRLKPQLIQYNSRNQKFYYKYLRVKSSDRIAPIKVWKIDIPTEEIRKQYEKKKRQYTDTLNNKILQELKKQEKVKKRQKCLKCGHTWIPRGKEKSKRCPSCNRYPE